MVQSLLSACRMLIASLRLFPTMQPCTSPYYLYVWSIVSNNLQCFCRLTNTLHGVLCYLLPHFNTNTDIRLTLYYVSLVVRMLWVSPYALGGAVSRDSLCLQSGSFRPAGSHFAKQNIFNTVKKNKLVRSPPQQQSNLTSSRSIPLQ